MPEAIEAKELLMRESNGEFPKQKTTSWYEIRSNMITASEIASVLECNIYKSRYELLLQKIMPYDSNVSESPALAWGNKFEHIALKFYEFYSGSKVHDIGLVTHPTYNWLGASPDGLILTGRLLEIKCPFMRSIGGSIPIYYWMQMQIQMEVCNINECDYLECLFKQYATKEDYDQDTSVDQDSKGVHVESDSSIMYWRLTSCSLKTVCRDRSWFNNNLHTMESFHTRMVHYKGLGTAALDVLYNDVKTQARPKRTCSTALVHPSKKPRIETTTNACKLIDWKYWVSASSIRNYMIDDPLLDWLSYYSIDSKPYISYSDGDYKYVDKSTRCVALDEFIKPYEFPKSSNTFQSCIMKKGIVFEKYIIDIIRDTYPNEFVEVGSYQQAKSTSKHLETIAHITKGTPIIYQGVLHDYETQTFGVPDLLVRSDYLNKLFGDTVIKRNKIRNCVNGNLWHYRVVEIKFSVLNLCADGKHLQNGIKGMLSNKGQLYVYNKILGKIQNFTPSKSYILGKSSIYKKRTEVFTGGPFDRVAHINYMKNDAFIRKKTADAVRWIRSVRANGYKWKLFPPSKPQLRPNMSNNSDGDYHNIKLRIADMQNDVTQLWMCGVKNREFAINRGITNWRTHPNLTSEMLGITGDKRVNTLQLIIDFNQDTDPTKAQLIYPKKIETELYNWRNGQTLEMFIDFETVSDLVSDEFVGSLIFNVGIGYKHNNKFEFKGFTAEGLTIADERKLFIDMHSFINELSQTYNVDSPNLWHWSHAERTFYRSALCRHLSYIPAVQILTQWCDLLKIFKDEPIVIRGALNFTLKSVVKAMYKHGFIPRSYQESKISNGLDAMVYAHKAYMQCKETGDSFIDSVIIKDIEFYNQIDCMVLGDILTYLRNDH
jgi:putative phage-type endonuclease